MAIKIEDRPTPPWGHEKYVIDHNLTDRQVRNAIKVLAERFDLYSGGSVQISKKGRDIVCVG